MAGTLERYAGDGVMVIFNDPVPVENPPLQAVLMALEMRGAIGALTDRWRRLGHDYWLRHRHRPRICHARHHWLRGTLRLCRHRDGVECRIPALRRSHAQILISPRVFMAVEEVVSVEPVGEFSLKGIRRPLAAYNVLAAVSSKP